MLSYEEIKGVTRAMVEAAGGIGLTIAATGPWPAEQSLEYARFAESLGADAVLREDVDRGAEQLLRVGPGLGHT